jgi:glycogen operon protein
MESVRPVQLQGGRAWPLGAHCTDGGVNFAVFSEHATSIELCLFDASGERELSRTPLPGRTGDVWHGLLPDAGPGLLYGLRADGPWRPDEGHRFNVHKLLLDPYAREIAGRFAWRPEHCASSEDDRLDTRDNAEHALKARVVADNYDWAGDRAPRTPLRETVFYELHVRGFSKLHPGVAAPLRGTYAGLASDVAVEHLKRLGVTAVSLLPVHQHLDEQRLVRQGLSNYWGYNTIGYFAVEPTYASGVDGPSARDEFRAMVRTLHAAGIEVILDVVFNHTAETDELGPNLSWRGLDNGSYYRLQAANRALYENASGCGNTLDIRHPRVLQLVMDSLRYWVAEMHVDGFRFDLASVLGRDSGHFERRAAFFKAVAQDPLLQGVKLIAEPWDLGPGGYRLGQFPPGWLEWNDRYRDSMRKFWLHGGVARGEFAQRFSASSDIFDTRRRAPGESVNFITAHDGFTLRDLVSYNHRHNLANGEHNRDGHEHNHSWNGGVEGETNDRQVLAVRELLQRALLATLLLAQGTPMLTAGDELGHTQGGNNNPYCQDNATTWIDWSRADTPLIAFTARLIALRRGMLPLGDRWATGAHDEHGLPDLGWLRSDGSPLTADDWTRLPAEPLGILIGRPGAHEQPLLLLANPQPDERAFRLPQGRWHALFDAATAAGESAWRSGTDASFPLSGRSMAVLARTAA